MEGAFVKGKRHGYGVFIYANGDVYEGSWEDDLKHGEGVYTFHSCGSKKKGSWNKGNLNGPGEIVHADHTISGTFDADGRLQLPANVAFKGNFVCALDDPALLGQPLPVTVEN
ncbi:hypothetical protein HK102_003202 [Quaeritorhiza haematococci]|nr:hypothetical protein HK102_003202 [Quaeritorhiza haematococci]